jgi:ATP-dependent DNA ligase
VAARNQVRRLSGDRPAFIGDGNRIFRHACGLGLEGIVSKRIGSRYGSGRTRGWLKTKNPNFERS